MSQFVQLPLDLLEALLGDNLTHRELRVLLGVMNLTWGTYDPQSRSRRESAVIRGGDVQDLTGLDQRHVRRALAGLVERGILECHTQPTGPKPGVYGIQADPTRWTTDANPTRAKTARLTRAKTARPPGPNRPGKEGQIGPGKGAKSARVDSRNVAPDKAASPPVDHVDHVDHTDRGEGVAISMLDPLLPGGLPRYRRELQDYLDLPDSPDTLLRALSLGVDEVRATLRQSAAKVHCPPLLALTAARKHLGLLREDRSQFDGDDETIYFTEDDHD